MDKNFALRLVIFEYLLPLQRRRRVEQLERAFSLEDVNIHWTPSYHLAGVVEELHRISEQMLHSQGFATSYTYPITFKHENCELRRNVSALVDSEGPFVWNKHCARRADPLGGFRVHHWGWYMSSGRFKLGVRDQWPRMRAVLLTTPTVLE